MPYKLKPNMANFEMVDGPFTGRKFEAGRTYEDVPVTEAHRFQELSILSSAVSGLPNTPPAPEAELRQAGEEEKEIVEQKLVDEVIQHTDTRIFELLDPPSSEPEKPEKLKKPEKPEKLKSGGK